MTTPPSSSCAGRRTSSTFKSGPEARTLDSDNLPVR
jgi:hypothetical protein